MYEKSLINAITAALLIASGAAFGQQVQDDIGGTEDSGTYEETGSGPEVDAVPEPDLWSAEDSAFFIPAYTTYLDWNTDQIFERRAAVLDTVNLRLAWAACDYAMPVCGPINSPFGPRHGRHHYGTDLDLETGDQVLSAFAGKVRISRYNHDFGNVVVVRHPNGLETLYGHMSKRLVEVGDEVDAGDVLGLGGSTGRSTGSHLHFETRYLGHPINPELFFDLKEGVLRAEQVSISPHTFHKATAPVAHIWRVRRGDTLSRISRRTGVSVNRLCQINRIGKRSTLRIGQRIRTR